MTQKRMMVFIDGENFVRGYERVVQAKTHIPRGHYTYSPKNYVWCSGALSDFVGDFDVLRVNYYYSLVGNDEEKRNQSVDLLRESDVFSRATFGGFRLKLSPHVYVRSRDKKGENGEKVPVESKRLDIEICTDVLSNTYQDNFDVLMLVTNDLDFEPLIREVKRYGKQVVLGTFRLNASRELARIADQVVYLENCMFKGEEKGG